MAKLRITWRKPAKQSLLEKASNPGALGEIDTFTCDGVHISKLNVLTFENPSVEIEAMATRQLVSIGVDYGETERRS